ncbi:hypothetical protein H5410_051966 [Solanum commersonii]|uniref:Gag-pol polyprotein n=1 Tax=Solanum commersonii TaxID=4109 RepID=A0A9J5WZX6_SOLCO|nr:hypothetical protein H5410_051966 [Solanum commersonii]
MPIGESVLAERVYRDCSISINHKSTMADLMELYMVDFDVILGMGWLNAYYALVDSRTRVVKFQFPNEPSSVELSKPGQGFAWCQQWSWSASPAQEKGWGEEKTVEMGVVGVEEVAGTLGFVIV